MDSNMPRPSLRAAYITAISLSICLYACNYDATPDDSPVSGVNSALVLGDTVGTMLAQVSHASEEHEQLLTYTVVGGYRVHQGDIILGKESMAATDSSLLTDSCTMATFGQRWFNAVVPYDFDASIAAARQTTILKALHAWEELTPLRFVRRTVETDFVRFTGGRGCSSYVGRQGGMQYITLQDEASGTCMTQDIIMHEVGHAVGLWHEQSRTDRDAWVTVDLCYVQAGKEHNFNRESSYPVGAYDSKSIMHYASGAFRSSLRVDVPSCVTVPPKPTNGWPITNKDGSLITPSTFPTATDALGIGSLYGHVTRKDFNKDGRADLLWHNGTTGTTQVWFMSGTSMASQASIDPRYSVPDSSGWRLISNGDLNQDGKTDLLWHNGSTGATQAWFMDGVTMFSQAAVDPRYSVPDSSGWVLSATGDLNYDGKVDLLWHHGGTGVTQVWFMDGVTMASQTAVDPRYRRLGASGWRLSGTGDFNYDGKVDLLWHNGISGATQVWYMDGSTVVSEVAVDPRYSVPDSSGWRLSATGDFDYDGKVDLLWHNGVTGATQVWYMNGVNMASQAAIDPRYSVPDSSGWLPAGT